jgi:hypothetical protein
MIGWVGVFDQSFNRIPVSRLHEAYEDGYRVMAGYAGGGSESKWLTEREIQTWLALGPDTAIAALFEIEGIEPINEPSSGKRHALAARAAWRNLGYPDHCSISPAVDRNVTIAQARDQLVQYFSLWAVTDTAHAIPYVEMDAGAILYAKNISAGTMTPAAFSWDESDKLVTPANAPSHVIWTQEHNARKLYGGEIDTGHIRVSAPVWWKTPTSSVEEDMLATDKLSINPALFHGEDEATVGQLIVDGASFSLQGRNAVGVVDKKVDLLTAAVAAITAHGSSADTQAVINAVNTAAANESTLVKSLMTQIAGLTAKVTDLEAKLAKAGSALS